MTCNSGHTCVALKSQDDPTGRCAGTCDSTGACKSKRGQACDTVGGGCASGTSCSLENICCDTDCTGSCQACDVAGHLGTCTTLANNEAPHSGHAPCVTSDATCAGKCDGTRTSCTYPTASCGTATCTGLDYQAPGTCDAGVCKKPAVKTCDHVCSTSEGCTGVCTLNDKQCSPLGVPQKCNASGGWVDQTACSNGYVCSDGDCACPVTKTDCTTACVDKQSSPDHCGDCNHSCLGGTCSNGLCQPVAMTGDLGALPTLFAVDSSYAYYGLYTEAYRIALSSTGGTGTKVVTTPTAAYKGLIGTNVYYDQYSDYYYANISGSLPATGTNLIKADGSSNTLAYMRTSPLSSPQYAVEAGGGTGEAIYWISPSNTVATSWTLPTSPNPSYQFLNFGYWAYGNSVYWIQSVFDGMQGNLAGSGVFAVDSSTKTKKQVCALEGPNYSGFNIADVNAQSVLLTDLSGTSRYLYRAPNASSTSSPVSMTTMVDSSGGNVFQGVTEDSKGIYWLDGAGTIYRCNASNCTNSKTVLASGQTNTIASGFYQDSNALYFTHMGPYQIMRLAK